MSKISKSLVSIILILGIVFTPFSMVYAADIPDSNEKSTIIIVPGLLGSELFASKDQVIDSSYFPKGHRFWVPECVMPFIERGSEINLEDLTEFQLKNIKRDLELIAYDKNGKSKAEIMPSNPIMDCRENPAHRNFGTANYYQNMVKSIIKNTDESKYNIVFFSYDWRISCGESSKNLEKLINDNGYKNVTLVAHSMGGLVCSSYLSNPQNAAKVDRTIMMGAPLLGAARAFSAIDYGKFIDGFIGVLSAPIVSRVIKSVAENCPSIYELLPPKQYFDYSDFGYLNRPDKNACLAPINIKTYEDTIGYITSKRKWPKGAPRLLKSAQNFHDSLYHNNKFALEDDSIQLYNLVGFNLETVGQFMLTKSNCMWSDEKYVNGDNLVSINSALVGHSLDNKNNYFLKDISHTDLSTKKISVDMISKIINNDMEIYDQDNDLVKRVRPSGELF